MIDIEQKNGYLYLLRNTVLGGYKIGITTAPDSRFKALSVGDKSEIVGYWQHHGYRELERYFHKFYKEERVPQSEWFNLTDADVDTIVEQMHASGVTQYLEPDRRPAFVGSQFRFVDTPPHMQNDRGNWSYFSLLVVAAAIAYFTGALIN